MYPDFRIFLNFSQTLASYLKYHPVLGALNPNKGIFVRSHHSQSSGRPVGWYSMSLSVLWIFLWLAGWLPASLLQYKILLFHFGFWFVILLPSLQFYFMCRVSHYTLFYGFYVFHFYFFIFWSPTLPSGKPLNFIRPWQSLLICVYKCTYKHVT